MKLASHLLHASEDTVVDQPAAYAIDTGGVMVEGYYSSGPDVEWMTVSRKIS